MPGKMAADNNLFHFIILFFKENKTWNYMWIICWNAILFSTKKKKKKYESSVEMPPYFLQKKKKKRLEIICESSVEMPSYFLQKKKKKIQK